MNPAIRQYADDLYRRSLTEAISSRTKELTSLKTDMARQGFSGTEYRGMIKIHARFIGRDMMGRLTSFHEAFEHSGSRPSMADFDEIWSAVEETQRRELQSSTRQLADHSKQRGGPKDPTGSLEAAVAHEHDLVLQEWRVWRGRTNLVGFGREAFAISAVPALQNLPRKEELTKDLCHLLSSGGQVGVLFIDMDNFKAVNDVLGHLDGDRCLEEVARIIGSVILEKGRLYRYAAGDEFMVVLPSFDRSESAATAERIRKAVDNENPGGQVKVTASVGGVVASNMTHESAEAVLKAADSAMYQAKRTRNSVFLEAIEGT